MFRQGIYGPECSSASQVNRNRTTLNPYPLIRPKCSSASFKENGAPTKLTSSASNRPSLMCDGINGFVGFFESAPRFTPRSVRILVSVETETGQIPSFGILELSAVNFDEH